MHDVTHDDIIALADGQLDADRAAAVEAAVAASPELAAALDEQQRGRALLRSVDARAPDSVHAGVASLRARRAPARARRPLVLGGAAAAALAVAILAVALITPAGGPGAPTVVEASQLSDRPAFVGPPPPSTREPKLLVLSGPGGQGYPNWAAKFGWRASGARMDELGDRLATTVFYAKGGKRIGYTIVSGAPLPAPGGARRAVVEGTELRVFKTDGRTVVRWLRGGGTCVLSGRGVPAPILLKLAGWKGKGAIPF